MAENILDELKIEINRFLDGADIELCDMINSLQESNSKKDKTIEQLSKKLRETEERVTYRIQDTLDSFSKGADGLTISLLANIKEAFSPLEEASKLT